MKTNKRPAPFIVPDSFMIPLGSKATKEFDRCAENWSDSEVLMLRSQLPMEYHAVPVDALRRRWVNIRKHGTEGYRVNGHGPAVGSRKKKSKEIPKWYQEYLDSDSWKERRVQWLEFWDYRCCLCNRSDIVLDVHHRTYDRIGKELISDCVLLCRSCHELVTDNVEIPSATP